LFDQAGSQDRPDFFAKINPVGDDARSLILKNFESRHLTTFLPSQPGLLLFSRKTTVGAQLGTAAVAPACSRLYRGFAIRKVQRTQWRREFRRAADCKSAIRQVANLRCAKKPAAVSSCAPTVESPFYFLLAADVLLYMKSGKS
jgi:hypothetical protein